MTTLIDRPQQSSSAKRACYVEPFAAFMAFALVFQAIAPAQSPVAQAPVAEAPMVLDRKPNPLGLTGTAPNKAMANTSITSGPSAAPARLNSALNDILQSNAVTAKSTPANCVFQGFSYIIQYVCTGNRLTGSTPPDSGLLSAIQQFESDSIKQWRQLFNLSNTDADVTSFYQTARSSLRNSVRAMMLLRLIDIPFRLQNANNNVSDNEKTVYAWFQGRVQARIVQMDQDAVNDKNSWQNNRCTWQPDPDLEKAYGFFYIPCVGTQVFNTAPNADYFTAAAYKKDFSLMIASLIPANAPVLPHAAGSHASPRAGSASGAQTSTAQAIIQGQSESMSELLGIIGGSTLGVFGATGITLGVLSTTVPAIRNKIFPTRSQKAKLKQLRQNKINKCSAVAAFGGVKPKTASCEREEDFEEEVKENAEDANTEAIENGDAGLETSATDVTTAANEAEDASELDALGATDAEIESDSALAGPIGVAIGIAIVIITTIVTIIADEAVSEQSLAALDSTLSSDSNNAPNLFTLFQTAAGQEKVLDCWAEVTWPEVASDATVPPAGPTDPVVVSYPQNQPNNPQVNNFAYADWGGAQVSLAGVAGQFSKASTYQLSPSDTPAGSNGLISATDLSPILQYIDWAGDYYWASRVGIGFVVGKRFVAEADTDCPAGPGGVTTLSDLTGCSSYVANSLQVLDKNGNPQTVLISSRPVVNLPNTEIDFNTIESPLTASVPITGYPVPTVTFDNLPTGIIVNLNVDGNGSVNFVMDGTKIKPGTYVTQIHATNYAQTTTAAVTFNITGPDFEAPPTFDPYPLSYRDPIWTTGVPVNQFFHATSAYQVTWSSNIPLPSGMSLSILPGSNSIGFVGTPPAGSAGLLRPLDDTEPYVQACDGQNRCIKQFVIVNIADAPRAHFVLPDASIQLDFPVGQQRSFTLSTTGAITPVSFSTSPTCPFKVLPSWIFMTDNGNGSVTFSGNAPDNSGVDQVNLASVVIHTAGLFDLTCDTNNLQFFLDSNPQIFDADPTVTAGQNVGFFLHTNVNYSVGDLQLTSTPPPGMSFIPAFNFNPPSVGGSIPATGSGGQYKLNFQMMAIKGHTSPVNQTVIFTINEPPSWPGSSSIGGTPFIQLTMMSGVNNQYVFKPGGFPTYNSMLITRGSALMPQGVTFSSGTEINPNSGGAVLKGNPDPSTIGHGYVIPVTADNGIGNPATMDVLLTIVPPGDVTGDGKVDCSDITLVKSHLNTKAGTANYNGAADVNGDGVVNILDLTFVTAHLPQGTVCH